MDSGMEEEWETIDVDVNRILWFGAEDRWQHEMKVDEYGATLCRLVEMSIVVKKIKMGKCR
jgi:hypothetical protein